MSIVREVAQGYRIVRELSHTQAVRRLYRGGLKALQSWACDRGIWLREAAKLRARFDSAAGVPRGEALRLLREGKAELLAMTHPDPYTGEQGGRGGRRAHGPAHRRGGSALTGRGGAGAALRADREPLAPPPPFPPIRRQCPTCPAAPSSCETRRCR